jgi:hypothetical protein
MIDAISKEVKQVGFAPPDALLSGDLNVAADST